MTLAKLRRPYKLCFTASNEKVRIYSKNYVLWTPTENMLQEKMKLRLHFLATSKMLPSPSSAKKIYVKKPHSPKLCETMLKKLPKVDPVPVDQEFSSSSVCSILSVVLQVKSLLPQYKFSFNCRQGISLEN